MLVSLILSLVFIYLLIAARKSLKRRTLQVFFSRLRPRHFVRALLTLGVMGFTAALLLEPESLLRWGWWGMLGGSGNVLLGQTANAHGSSTRLIVPIIILILLVLSLSEAAFSEEMIFRSGDEHRPFSERLKRSIVFGLEHIVMGIPIGAALVLSIGGLSFSGAYRKAFTKTGSADEAIVESTLVHIAFNLIISALLLLYLLMRLTGIRHS